MEAQIEEEAKKEEVVQRSEEVQTIIDRSLQEVQPMQ